MCSNSAHYTARPRRTDLRMRPRSLASEGRALGFRSLSRRVTRCALWLRKHHSGRVAVWGAAWRDAGAGSEHRRAGSAGGPGRAASLGCGACKSATPRGRATCPLQSRSGRKEPVWGQNPSYVLNPEIGVSDLNAETAKSPHVCTHALPSRVWTHARRVTSRQAGQSSKAPRAPARAAATPAGRSDV